MLYLWAQDVPQIDHVNLSNVKEPNQPLNEAEPESVALRKLRRKAENQVTGVTAAASLRARMLSQM